MEVCARSVCHANVKASPTTRLCVTRPNSCQPSAPISSSGQLIAGNNNYPASVNGVGTEYLDIRQLTVENGEMFTEADISSAKVCVIGKTIVDNLFPDGSDPVGKIIRFSKIPFRVVVCSKSKRIQFYGTRPGCRSACTIPP